MNQEMLLTQLVDIIMSLLNRDYQNGMIAIHQAKVLPIGKIGPLLA